MSRNRRPKAPHINNSGIDRTPTNVWLLIDDDPRGPFRPHLTQEELQEFAEKHPDWNLFVLEERRPDGPGMGAS